MIMMFFWVVSLHSVTTQKNDIVILTTMRTSDLTESFHVAGPGGTHPGCAVCSRHVLAAWSETRLWSCARELSKFRECSEQTENCAAVPAATA
jgi:hypothetical protein